MKLKELQDAMIAAMKAKDKFRKDAISALVSAVKKKGIDNGCRDNIPDEMANEAILKEIKSVKEQIDTCPADRTELLEEYKKRYEIMSEFAPKMLSAEEVKSILEEKFAEVLATKNKGQIMKAVMGELKGKADGKELAGCRPVTCRHRESDIRQGAFRHLHDLLERNPAHREEHHVFGGIEPPHKRLAGLAAETEQRLLVSQDVMSQRMSVEQQILEFIEDQFRRAVLV